MQSSVAPMSDTIGARTRVGGRMARLALLLLACLLIIANGGAAFISMVELRDANARMERAMRAILELKVIEDRAEDSNQDQRNYRLFGSPQTLGDYRNARAELPSTRARSARCWSSGMAYASHR